MKKILSIISVTGLLLFNTGCSDWFDLVPSTSLPNKEAIKNAGDLQLALNGVYQMLTYERCGYGSDFMFYADCTGGDVQFIDISNHIAPFMKFEVDQTHNLSENTFFAMYEPIAFANMAMAAAENLDMENADIKRLYGELKAIRAMLHFDVARLFAQLPTVTGVNMEAADSGIIIAKEVYAPNHKFARETLKASYDFIVDELVEAMGLLNTAAGKAKNMGGINYWTAEAALARVYLYLGNNNDAYTAAVDVITNGGYTLFTTSNYISSWAKQGADEFICEFTTSDLIANNAQRHSLGNYTNPDGYGEVAASETFKALLAGLSDNDIRKQSVTERSSSTGGSTGYYTLKYPGKEGASTPLYNNNPKILRLAEVYLIAAEAAVKGGSTAANADKYYNDLKRTRYATGTYTDKSAVTLDDILEERRIELFSEGQRMWDLKRNNKPVPKYDGSGTTPANDNKLVLPIPLSELDISHPLLKQNPGYGQE